MVFKPWLDTIRVEYVSTWQEVAFHAYFEVTHANGASWHLDLSIITFFAVLFFDRNLG